MDPSKPQCTSGKLLQVFEGHSNQVSSVAFSLDGHLIVTCDHNGRVFLWKADEPEIGHLMGAYVATYEIGAIHWQDATHVVFADKVGPYTYHHIYRLKLEGKW